MSAVLPSCAELAGSRRTTTASTKGTCLRVRSAASWRISARMLASSPAGELRPPEPLAPSLAGPHAPLRSGGARPWRAFTVLLHFSDLYSVKVLRYVEIRERFYGPRRRLRLVAMALHDLLPAALAFRHGELAEQGPVVQHRRGVDPAVIRDDERRRAPAVLVDQRRHHLGCHERHVCEHDRRSSSVGPGCGLDP